MTGLDSIIGGCGRGLRGVRNLSDCMLKCIAALQRMMCSVRASWLAVFDACMYYSVWSLLLSDINEVTHTVKTSGLL